jgi:hypothetical protein
MGDLIGFFSLSKVLRKETFYKKYKPAFGTEPMITESGEVVHGTFLERGSKLHTNGKIWMSKGVKVRGGRITQKLEVTGYIQSGHWGCHES